MKVYALLALLAVAVTGTVLTGCGPAGPVGTEDPVK